MNITGEQCQVNNRHETRESDSGENSYGTVCGSPCDSRRRGCWAWVANRKAELFSKDEETTAFIKNFVGVCVKGRFTVSL